MTAAGGRRLQAARRFADRCVDGLAPGTAGPDVPAAALAYAWTGAPDLAARWADHAVTQARDRGPVIGLVLALLVRADVAYRQGRWAACLSDAREAARSAEEVRALAPAAAGTAYAARALIRRGQLDAAGALLTDVRLPEDTHPLVAGAVLVARGELALAGGDHAEALRLFLECGHRLATRGIANPACLPWRPHAARCYEALGERAAARTIAAAPEAAAPAGAPEAPPSRPTAAPGPSAASPVRLSAAERRVTELVLRGFSNQETAERLCLSKRTVDTHLGRIYRRLGIRGRPELAQAVAELEDQ
jgi:DNA-binding CsgD family transcriptional regulator